MALLGAIALSFYAIHASYHVFHGKPENSLWACHLGAAIVGVGFLISSPTTSGIGTLFLAMGTPLWLLDLAAGAEFFPTSCLTHVGGLVIGLYGATRLGVPRGVWWKALITLAVLIGLSRLLTPASANVNVAFAVQRGCESFFHSHATFLAIIMFLAGGFFFIIEHALRRWLAPSDARIEGP
ncbi:MAG: hypothetical protein SGI88_16015 [Candidatus Hydrogenedentes bacterium]|nr:hypothetical protein [Candidatus Hydrogenedentota bacterium]